VNTMMALSILKGNGDPIPPDAMYRTILHTIAWGGMTCTIRAGSLVECLKANIVMSPALERWLAYGA